MRLCLLFLLAIALSAQERPVQTSAQTSKATEIDPNATVATAARVVPEIALKAEIDSLKAELAELRLIFQYEQQICQSPDLVQARFTRMQAATKAQAAKAPQP